MHHYTFYVTLRDAKMGPKNNGEKCHLNPAHRNAAGKFFTNWPPIPELPLIWMVFYVTFWVVISPDVSKPDVKTLVCKYVSEALGWTIHDPVCRICENAVLKEYYLFRSSNVAFLSPSGNPLHGKNEAIFCCHVMFFIRVSSASDDLSLIMKEKHIWTNCTFFIEFCLVDLQHIIPLLFSFSIFEMRRCGEATMAPFLSRLKTTAKAALPKLLT